MTKHFRVTVQDDNGERKEIRRVLNAPDLPPDKLEAFVRKEWAKHYAGENYPTIEQLGQDERPSPPAGAFPDRTVIPTA